MRFITSTVFAAMLTFIVPASSGAEFARVRPQNVAPNEILEAPKPEFPDFGRQQKRHGTGVFLLRTKIATGVVIEIITGQSTGNPLLDGAAAKAFRRWRFKPGVLIHRDIHKPRLNRPIVKDECLLMIPVTF